MITLKQTCEGCPEQYDAFDGDEQVGYLRLRWGHFTVEAPDCGGTLLASCHPHGDGGFESWEREHYLTLAKGLILAWRMKHAASSSDDDEDAAC